MRAMLAYKPECFAVVLLDTLGSDWLRRVAWGGANKRRVRAIGLAPLFELREQARRNRNHVRPAFFLFDLHPCARNGPVSRACVEPQATRGGASDWDVDPIKLELGPLRADNLGDPLRGE